MFEARFARPITLPESETDLVPANARFDERLADHVGYLLGVHSVAVLGDSERIIQCRVAVLAGDQSSPTDVWPDFLSLGLDHAQIGKVDVKRVPAKLPC